MKNPRNIIKFTKKIFLKRKSEGRYESTEKIITNSNQMIVKEKKNGESSRETVPESYTKFYENDDLAQNTKITSNCNSIPKIGKCKSFNRSENLLKRNIENTTPVFFTNKETEWEEMYTVTTERTELSVLSDAVVKLLLIKSDSKKKAENLRKKRSQTYTGEYLIC